MADDKKGDENKAKPKPGMSRRLFGGALVFGGVGVGVSGVGVVLEEGLISRALSDETGVIQSLPQYEMIPPAEGEAIPGIVQKNPTQKLLQGGGKNDVFMVQGSTEQTIQTGLNKNAVCILGADFGKKTIEVGNGDNPYRRVRGTFSNTLVLDSTIFNRETYKDCRLSRNEGDLVLTFERKNPAPGENPVAQIIIKDQFAMGAPTVEKIALISPQNEVRDVPLNNAKDIKQWGSSLFQAFTMGPGLTLAPLPVAAVKPSPTAVDGNAPAQEEAPAAVAAVPEKPLSPLAQLQQELKDEWLALRDERDLQKDAATRAVGPSSEPTETPLQAAQKEYDAFAKTASARMFEAVAAENAAITARANSAVNAVSAVLGKDSGVSVFGNR